jgi:hypothetical protein
MVVQPVVGLWPPFQFLDLLTQSVGLLGRGISPSQGRYMHTGQNKHRINAHRHPCVKWNSYPRLVGHVEKNSMCNITVFSDKKVLQCFGFLWYRAANNVRVFT